MSASQTSASALNQQGDISSTVTRLFSDLKRDMATIIDSSDLMYGLPSATGQQRQHTSTTAAATQAGPGQAEGRPVLRLSHGRTESETAGYDDYELPQPVGKLPEALRPFVPSTAHEQQHADLQDAGSFPTDMASAGTSPRYSSTAAEASALLASTVAAAEQLVSSVRSSETATEASASEDPMQAAGDPMQAQQQVQHELMHLYRDVRKRADMLFAAPAIQSIGGRGGSGGVSDSMDSSDGGAEGYAQQNQNRQLSYRELLDRALAWNPRVKGAAPAVPSSTGGSTVRMSMSADANRGSSAGFSTASSSSSGWRQRPSSTGRSTVRISGGGIPSPPDYRQHMQYNLGQPGRSKFPATGQHRSQHNSHYSMPEQHRAQHTSSYALAAAGNGRILSGTADAYGPRARRMGADAAQQKMPQKPKTLYRSRSAPREEAAARRHIERMNASPTRAAAVTASRESILSGQQQVHMSWQREQQLRQSGGSLKGSAAFLRCGRKTSARSPDAQVPMRLTKDEWDRVTNRLHQYASGKQAQAGPQGVGQSYPRSNSTSPGRYDRLSGPAGPLAPDFYLRQEALLQRRAALAARRRRSDEDELEECTFRPQINPSSRNLQRSVTQLHAWDARRRLSVFAKALDKCEHECKGYTFTPEINPFSRQLALANYAVAPDPARPWTLEPTSPGASPGRSGSNPKRNSPSPDAVRMLRDALPPANIIMMAGPTAQQQAESVMELLGGPAAAPSVSARHYGVNARVSVSTEYTDGSAAWAGSRLTAYHHGSAAHEDEVYQRQQQEEQQQQRQARTVVGMPMEMPVLGRPADGSGVARNSLGSSGGGSHGPSSNGAEGISVSSCADGTIVIRLASSNSQQAEKVTVLGDSAADRTAAEEVSQVPQKQHGPEGALEPQLLLAALKLTPAQAQQALEEGRSRCSTGGKAELPAAPAAVAAVRNSSSGGMAPGTPGGGSLGGVNSNGGAAFARPPQQPMRDDSAGGMYSATLAKKLSAGGIMLASHKPSASPLSRAQQQPGQKQQQEEEGSPNSYSEEVHSKDANLQDLATSLGMSPGDKAAQQLRGTGLNTVPAYFVSTAEPRGMPPAIETVKRPSSYSQRYQRKLSSSAGSNAKQVSDAAVHPELMDLMNSLTIDSSSSPSKGDRHGSSCGRGHGSSGGGYTGSSPPGSPTFAQLKARWMAKECASRESSGAGHPRSGYSSPTRTSGGGHAAAATAAVAASTGQTSGKLSSSLVSGPQTPMHHHQQQTNPFSTAAGLPKQYSTAQMLNAHARHGSGGGRQTSSLGGEYDAAADSLAAAAAAVIQGGSDAASAAAALLGSGSDDSTVLRQGEGPEATNPLHIDLSSVVGANIAAAEGAWQAGTEGQVLVVLTDGSSNSVQSCQALAACSSVISVPDAAAYGTAVATESCNGRPQTLVTEKVEVLLEGTRSVPFELVLSPRSKFLIASTAPRGSSSGGGSSSNGTAQLMAIDVASPLGQHLLRLLMETGRVSDSNSSQGGVVPTTALTLSLAQWQWLQQQYQQQQQQSEDEREEESQLPLATTPALVSAAEPAMGIPLVYKSNAVDAVTQLLKGSNGDREPSGNGNESAFTTSAAAVAAVAAACEAATPAAVAAVSRDGPAAGAVGSREALIRNLLRPAAASPHLIASDSCTPIWGTPRASRSVLAPSQLQQQQQQQEQELVVTAFSRSSAGSSGSGSGSNAGSSADSSPGVSQFSVVEASPQQQQQQQDGGDLAAELAALLQSAGSMSPEQKADAVARTFAKTINRLNMSSDVLQHTIAALDPTTASHEDASTSATPAPAATALTSNQSVTEQPATAGAAGLSTAPAEAAASAPQPGFSDLDMSDMSDAESIQQLLERVSKGGLLMSPQSSMAQSAAQQQQQQQQQSPVSTITAEPTAATTANSQLAGGRSAGKSWASIVAAPRSSCP